MRVRFRFTGRVQGVGFRATARRLASGYRVTGWVCNDPDGTVAMEAQGEPSELTGFSGALQQAMGARITHTDTQEAPHVPHEAGFVIRH